MTKIPAFSLVAKALLGLSVVIQGSSTTLAQEVEDVQSVLSTQLQKATEEYELIGLAAAVIQDGNVIAKAASGLRRKSGDDPIRADDKFHIGSIGKSMTAMVIMRLFERGLLEVDAPISNYMPGYEFHEDWAGVTLAHLLVHTAGAPRDFPGSLFEKEVKPDRRIARDRAEALQSVLKKKVDAELGDEHAYSNVGYTLIGHIAELVTGKPWQALIREEVWDPLELTTAGFGPPKAGESGEQPWGHRPAFYRGELWGIPAVGPMWQRDPSNPKSDLPAIIRPAGLNHMNMSDLARYGYEYLAGRRGESELMRKESFEFLQSARIDIGGGLKYANGSMVFDEIGLIQTKNKHTYWATGWNTTFVGFIILLPDQNAVVTIATNDGRLTKATRSFYEIAEAVSSALPEPRGS